MKRIDKRFDKAEEKSNISIKMLWTAIKELEEKMYTKADHERFMVWMDEAMAELREARDDRKLIGTN